MQKNLAKQPVYKYRVNFGAEIDNYQWKVLLLNIFLFQLILVAIRKIWTSFIYKWWQWTRCMWFTCLYVSSIKNIFESGILVSGVSTAWEDTDDCVKQYRCVLAVYLITVLSSLYVIIMDCTINAPVHGDNVVGGLNKTDKYYLKGKM